MIRNSTNTITMTPTQIVESLGEMFDRKFPLSFFATENYSGGHDEIGFHMWQDRQTKSAFNHQDSIKSHITTTFLDFIEAEIRYDENGRERIEDHHEKLHPDCPRCIEIQAHNFALSQVIAHLESLKDIVKKQL